MRIIPPDDLRMQIAIKLTVMPGWVQTKTGIRGLARDEALNAIMSALSECVVVAPDPVGFNADCKPGKFGLTEPHPFPELAD